MIDATVGCGYKLQMNKKSKLYKADDERTNGRRNRYNCVKIECVHSGKPRKNALVLDVRARKKTNTCKIGCNFGVPMFWGANSRAPNIGKNVCLSHTNVDDDDAGADDKQHQFK
eukprot:g14498.t1